MELPVQLSGQAPAPPRELWQLWAQKDILEYFDMFFWNIIGGFGDILRYIILLYPIGIGIFWVENMTNLLSTLCASPFLWAWVVCTYESNSCPEVPGAFGTEDTGGASAAQDGNGLECSIDSRMRNYAI